MIFCRYCDQKIYSYKENQKGLHDPCHEKVKEYFPELEDDSDIVRAHNQHLISYNTFSAIDLGVFCVKTTNHLSRGFELNLIYHHHPYILLALSGDKKEKSQQLKRYKKGNPIKLKFIKGLDKEEEFPYIDPMYHRENKKLQELINQAANFSSLELINALSIDEPLLSFAILTKNTNLNHKMFLDIKNLLSSMGLLFLSDNKHLSLETIEFLVDDGLDEAICKNLLKHPNITPWISWKISQKFPNLMKNDTPPTSVEAMLSELERLQKSN